MTLFHIRVGLSLHVILKWALGKTKGPQRLMPPFEGEHFEHVDKVGRHLSPPKAKSLGSHMVG